MSDALSSGSVAWIVLGSVVVLIMWAGLFFGVRYCINKRDADAAAKAAAEKAAAEGEGGEAAHGADDGAGARDEEQDISQGAAPQGETYGYEGGDSGGGEGDRAAVWVGGVSGGGGGGGLRASGRVQPPRPDSHGDGH